MGRRFLYRVPIIRRKKPASETPTWDSEADLYLRVNLATLAWLRAVLSYAVDRYWFVGTEAEIEAAVEALHEQVSEPALRKEDICGDETPIQWGAEFRIRTDEGGASIFQARQGEGLPAPMWEFRIDERDGVRWLQFRTEGGGGLWVDAGVIKE